MSDIELWTKGRLGTEKECESEVRLGGGSSVCLDVTLKHEFGFVFHLLLVNVICMD